MTGTREQEPAKGERPAEEPSKAAHQAARLVSGVDIKRDATIIQAAIDAEVTELLRVSGDMGRERDEAWAAARELWLKLRAWDRYLLVIDSSVRRTDPSHMKGLTEVMDGTRELVTKHAPQLGKEEDYE